MKDRSIVFTLLLLFSFLLFFPSQTLEASRAGLLLWFDTLLPTLLPFLIISQLILKTSLVNGIQKLAGPFFRHLFHCSENGAFCLICGFLCGYPVGARLIALQMKEDRLSTVEGQYLLSFCNNVSPVFCISYGLSYAMNVSSAIPYLLIIYGSSLLFGLITRPQNLPSGSDSKKQTSPAENIVQLIDVCIIDSFLIMIRLCGYMILFSIFCKAVFLFLPKNLSKTVPLFYGLLEITGGLSMISKLSPGIYRNALGILSLTFGGFCCIFQTSSVIKDTSLSLKKYVFHKLLITLMALIFFLIFAVAPLLFK